MATVNTFIHIFAQVHNESLHDSLSRQNKIKWAAYDVFDTEGHLAIFLTEI